MTDKLTSQKTMSSGASVRISGRTRRSAPISYHESEDNDNSGSKEDDEAKEDESVHDYFHQMDDDDQVDQLEPTSSLRNRDASLRARSAANTRRAGRHSAFNSLDDMIDVELDDSFMTTSSITSIPQPRKIKTDALKVHASAPRSAEEARSKGFHRKKDLRSRAGNARSFARIINDENSSGNDSLLQDDSVDRSFDEFSEPEGGKRKLRKKTRKAGAADSRDLPSESPLPVLQSKSAMQITLTESEEERANARNIDAASMDDEDAGSLDQDNMEVDEIVDDDVEVDEIDDDGGDEQLDKGGAEGGEDEMDDDEFVQHLLNENQRRARKNKLTNRQRAARATTPGLAMDLDEVLAATSGKQKKVARTTEEEALRKSEHARRRKIQVQQKAEDSKNATIHRLLKKQASKKSRAEQAEERRAEQRRTIKERDASFAEKSSFIRYTSKFNEHTRECAISLHIPSTVPINVVFPGAGCLKGYPTHETPVCDAPGCQNTRKYKFYTVHSPATLVNACTLQCYQILKQNS